MSDILNMCWLCRRTPNSAMEDLREIVINDKYNGVQKNIKKTLVADKSLVVVPDSSIFNEIYFDSKLAKVEENEYKDVSDQTFAARIVLCSVCAAILSVVDRMHDDKVSYEELEEMQWVLKKPDDV